MLRFERCNHSSDSDNLADTPNIDPFPGVECKSDEEITEWIKRKFLLIYENQFTFGTRTYDETRIIPEGKVLWIPLNSQIREETVYNVQVLDLRLQDEYVHVADYTEHEQSIFQNRYQLVRPYEF